MEWEDIKQTGDIFKVKECLEKKECHDEYQDQEMTVIYRELRQKVLEELKKDPVKFSITDVKNYVKAGVFTEEELVAEKIISPIMDVFHLPAIEQFNTQNYELEEGTDVYFFGLPNAGKTSLIMGLIGAVGHGFTINFKTRGGPFASALQLYVSKGMSPCGRPTDHAWAPISGRIEEKDKKGRYTNHSVNLINTPGYLFAQKVCNNDSSARFEDMGLGISKMLACSNRKVFFIIVDPTVDIVKFTFDEDQFDASGNRVGTIKKTEYIDQAAWLAKFVSLFEMDENKEFMKKVDAIHFIITKADVLGHTQEDRNRAAHDLLMCKYRGIVCRLVDYCRHTKRINRATDYLPRIFTYSLGRFYLKDAFEYDSKDSLYLIDALRHMTQGKKQTALRSLLGMATVKPVTGDYGVKIDMGK